MAKWVIRRKADGGWWGDVSGWVERLSEAHPFSESEHAEDLEDNESLCADGEEWVELDDAGQPVEVKPARMWVVSQGDGYYNDCATDLASARRYSQPQTLWFLPGRNVPVLVHPDGTVTLDEPAPAKKPEAKPEPAPDDPQVMKEARVYVNEDTVFLMPFGDLRKCRHCGCIVAGGPTACARCVRAEEQEPAPTVAQPSPYSESADEPIPYTVTDPVDEPIPYTVTDPVDALEELVAERERVNVRLARLSRKAMRLDEQIDSAKAWLRGGK